jgi:hypothetical protein
MTRVQFENLKQVFFCSAYNDISFILFQLEKSNFSTSLVYVVNNLGIYQFLLSLNVSDLSVHFIETKLKKSYNPLNWLEEFYFLNFQFGLELKQIRSKTIFLSATFYDCLSMFAAGRLKNYNKLYLWFAPESDEFRLCHQKISDKLRTLLYRVPIQTYNSVGSNVSGLSSKFTNQHISQVKSFQKIDLIDIQSKYAFKFTSEKPYVLILSSKEDEGVEHVYHSTKNIFLKIIDFCKNEKLLLKSHPRLGPSNFLSQFKFHFLPENIPLEFLDLQDCKLVIGTNSIALAHIADRGIISVSLLKMMDFYTEDVRNSYIKYLNVNNKNQLIKYPENLDILKLLIQNS